MREGSFDAAIRAHLELQRRNRRLEPTMPLDRYRDGVVAAAPAVEPPPQAPSAAADAPTEATDVRGARAPWDDPDSWWNVRDPAFDWGG